MEEVEDVGRGQNTMKDECAVIQGGHVCQELRCGCSGIGSKGEG